MCIRDRFHATEQLFLPSKANQNQNKRSPLTKEESVSYTHLDVYKRQMNLVARNSDHLKLLDVMVYYGKLMTLQDAFLPKFPDYLKINYTPQQYEWAKANEANIWNYFVENNLVFSDDTRLAERFINPAPFSKFYTEVDNDSSPQIGIFSGWQICRKFFQENPKTDLKTFLAMNAQDIFNQSHYTVSYTQLDVYKRQLLRW